MRGKLGLVVLGLSLGSGVGALALRLATGWPGLFPEPQWGFIVRESRPVFLVERRAEGPVLVARPRGFSPAGHAQEFPLKKTPGVPRILVAGESSADILGGVLKRRADGAAEVLNAGVGGGSLEMAARGLEEGLTLDPDAVVLFFGNNLFFDLPAPLPYALERLCGPLPLLSGVCRRRREARGTLDARLARLDGLLGRLGAWRRRTGAQVLVLTVPRNVLVPPGDFDREALAPELREASLLRESGRRREACAALRRALGARAAPAPYWSFTLGLWDLEDGELAGARRELGAALDADPNRTRANSAVNEALRRAARREGLALLDADRMVLERSARGIPALKEFSDNSHLSPANFEGLGAEVLARLAPSATADRTRRRLPD